MIDEVKEDGGLPSACPCADLALLVDKTAVQAMPPPEGSERSFLLGDAADGLSARVPKFRNTTGSRSGSVVNMYSTDISPAAFPCCIIYIYMCMCKSTKLGLCVNQIYGLAVTENLQNAICILMFK